ncbi:gephyrin-like molybdotransferase Glp [Belliella kenyensis]|uniref:Molybdopterin molybdenumtransferase n=1 Tax=Belliella kenyensis TaxID=1472724 RepID=A0ABV8EFY2_9BACT|nr:gephyrin-like molybdotransferase Glp [Belliella kenyensis]MCH7401064.1 molybdopterin molybdotransferase MoeA [Belliella kenyensis]MDN3604062.1 molybdopterin molybdotransferase MoeA [Belliella kenyensis]
MISVTKAKSILKNNLPKAKISFVPLEESIGYVIAEDVIAPMDVPSFDNSAMDGYAIAYDPQISTYQVEGEIAAGSIPKFTVDKGKAVRIFTGAPIPSGADTVVQQEWVHHVNDQVTFEIDKVKKGDHVRKKGTQTLSGSKILDAGSVISAGTVGLLASVGYATVGIFAAPSVGLIITGNEIKEVGQSLELGQIYNANGPILKAYLNQIGVKQIETFTVADHPNIVKQAIDKALAIHDLIIISGGISVGDYDFVKEGLKKANVTELFYKIKQKPGKPLYAGRKGNQLVFALPGNPASVITCFNQYVKPSILQWLGNNKAWKPQAILPLENDISKNADLTFLLKFQNKDGQVRILEGQESFNLKAFAHADGFALIPDGISHMKKGENVAVYYW